MIVGTYSLGYILLGILVAFFVEAFVAPKRNDPDPVAIGFVCLFWPFVVLVLLVNFVFNGWARMGKMIGA